MSNKRQFYFNTLPYSTLYKYKCLKLFKNNVMNMLPNIEEIKKWTNEKLFQVIASGERINWNCGITETQHEIDAYTESLYCELELRNSRFNINS